MKTRLLFFLAALLLSAGSMSVYGYTVTFKPGDNGDIAGATESSGTEAYAITPDPGYVVHTVFVNDRPQSSTTSLSITITENTVITATFVDESEVDVWDGSTGGTMPSGTGTVADPYLIDNCANWVYLANNQIMREGGNEFRLMKHLDFGNKANTPTVPKFIGFFDGNNKTFMNINMSSNGLFQTVTGNAANEYVSVISNLGIVSGVITANSGSIVGTIFSDGGSQKIGYDGRTYSFTCSIINCYNYASYSGTEGGGILGTYTDYNVLIPKIMAYNCYNRGDVGRGLVNKYQTRYPFISCYNAGKAKYSHFGNASSNNGGYIFYNSYYDDAYSDVDLGQFETNTTQMSTTTMRSQAMADKLNVSNLYQEERKIWLFDESGIINNGLPYLNEAYRVYSATDDVMVKPVIGYHPQFAYKGDSYRFTVTSTNITQQIAAGATVKVNGNPVTPDDNGEYEVDVVEEIIAVTVEGFTLEANEISVWDMTTDSNISGTGSEGDPYLIESAQQWAYFASVITNGSAYASKHYKLTTDIDFNGYWAPFFTSSNAEFSGTLDGNRHSLYNWWAAPAWSGDGTGNCALVRNTGTGATIKNISIENGFVYGTAVGVGGLIGTVSGSSTIEKCCVKACVVNTTGRTGGFIGDGQAHTLISNSYMIGTVLGPEPVGAFVGFSNTNSPFTYKNSYVANNISVRLGGDRLGGDAATDANSSDYFILGTGYSYSATEAELKSPATVTVLNTGQSNNNTFWAINETNNGFPAFNRTYKVTFPTIDNGVFESAEGYEAEIAYKGDTYKFQITPIPSLTAEDLTVSVNGSVVEPDAEGLFVIENVNADIVITYTGELKVKMFTYTLDFNDDGGTASTEAVNPLTYGDDITITIVPNEGYVAKVTINGELTPIEGNTLEILTVVSDLDIVVLFEKETFLIWLYTNPGGDIVEAEGSVNPVPYGESCTFNFVPESGYKVKEVYADGTPQGECYSHTFENVKEDGHELEVVFEEGVPTGIQTGELNELTITYKSGILSVDAKDQQVDKIAVYTLLGSCIAQQQGTDAILLGDYPIVIAVVEIAGVKTAYKVVME